MVLVVGGWLSPMAARDRVGFGGVGLVVVGDELGIFVGDQDIGLAMGDWLIVLAVGGWLGPMAAGDGVGSSVVGLVEVGNELGIFVGDSDISLTMEDSP